STSGAACTGCGTASVTWTWTAPTNLADGAHTIAFQGVDSYGDVASVSRALTVATGAPVISVTGGPADGSTTAGTLPLYSGDATAPTFDAISAPTGSTTITATFSEALNCTSVARADFSATINGASKTVSSVTCSGTADATIDLNFNKTTFLSGDNLAVTLVG